MRKSRFSVEQIVYALKQVDAGLPAIDLCRKMGISEQTFYVGKKRYAAAVPDSLARGCGEELALRRPLRVGFRRCCEIVSTVSHMPAAFARRRAASARSFPILSPSSNSLAMPAHNSALGSGTSQTRA
jgi:Transposase